MWTVILYTTPPLLLVAIGFGLGSFATAAMFAATRPRR